MLGRLSLVLLSVVAGGIAGSSEEALPPATRVLKHFDDEPSWSPDGSRIAFVSNRFGPKNICLMRADGSETERLTFGGINTYASWSADGRRILFRRVVGKDAAQIAIQDAATKQVTNVTAGDVRDGWPSWSPDNAHIVFASNRSGSVQIYTMRADGTGSRRLTNGVRCTVPRWSPDGRRLVFADAKDGEVDLYQVGVP